MPDTPIVFASVAETIASTKQFTYLPASSLERMDREAQWANVCIATIRALFAKIVLLESEIADLHATTQARVDELVESQVKGTLDPALLDTDKPTLLARIAELETPDTRRAELYRIARLNIDTLWTALLMVRDAIEEIGPVGSLPSGEYLPDSSPLAEAEAIVAALRAREEHVASLKAALTRAPCQHNDYTKWCSERTRLDGFQVEEWCEPCLARKEQSKGAME